MIVVVNDDDDDLFAFTCTSDYTDIAKLMKLPKSKYRTCLDGGASNDYSPNWTKFSNYWAVDRDITTADGRILKAVGMGDMHLELPNDQKKLQPYLKMLYMHLKWHLHSCQSAN